MKILLIGITKIKFMPYIHFYLDNFKRDSNQIDIFYWNRDGRKENLHEYENYGLQEFNCIIRDDWNLIRKVPRFLKYKNKLLSYLKNNNYDLIVSLHTPSAFLIRRYLHKYYYQKYILDYRDTTYESIPFFKKKIETIVKESYLSFCSSKGFLSLFSNETKSFFHPTHNLLLDSLSHRDYVKIDSESGRIRIAFWGLIRQEELNLKIIELISEDRRFELHYYGREEKEALSLKTMVESKNIKNVFFHGEYIPNDRYDFIKHTDIIHNIYCDNNTMLAMGNKLYDGAIFRIPQLCIKGSFMGLEVEENGIGLQVCLDNSFLDNVYNYYMSLDMERFHLNCDNYLSNILKEYNESADLLKEINKEKLSKNV